MAYDEEIAKRVTKLLQNNKVNFEEKKMFGGVGYMINEKMSIGVKKMN